MKAFFVLGCIPLLFARGVPAYGDEPTLIIENARVIIGTGVVRDSATVVICEDRIQSVLEKPPEASKAKRIDARGKTVMPGLIDTHVHLFSGSRGRDENGLRSELREDIPDQLKEYLRHGVTTIKSTGDPLTLILQVRDEVDNGTILGPRLLLTGPAITAPGGHPASTLVRNDSWWRSQLAVEVEGEDEARAHVRRLAKLRVDAIKVVYDGGPFQKGGATFSRLPENVMRVTIDEAHRQGLKATVHTWREQAAITAVKAGADGIEHGVVDRPLSNRELCGLLNDHKAFYIPTLRILQIAIGPEALANAKGNLKAVSEEGCLFALGTDTFSNDTIQGALPGVNTIQEIQLMNEAGIPPDRIILASTRDAARHLGLENELGTIESGKYADLIIIAGNPLEDLSVLEKSKIVVKDGQIVADARSE